MRNDKYFKKLGNIDIAASAAELRAIIHHIPPSAGHMINCPRFAAAFPELRVINLLTDPGVPHLSPATWALFEALKVALGGPVLRQAVVQVLPPQSKIGRHRDGLPPWVTRLHLPILLDGTFEFVIKQDRRLFQAGELWWTKIANHPHNVNYTGNFPRAALLMDLIDEDAMSRRAHARRPMLLDLDA